MKVLFLARYLPQEGSTTHMYTLARGLIDRGNEVHMMSAGPKEDESAINIFNEMIEYGMNHHKVGFPLKPSFNLLGKVIQLINYILAIPKALYIMFKIKPDIIHVHYPVTSYIAKIYGKLTGKKFITTHHISGIPKHPLHKKADFVIAISKELQMELYEKFEYDDKQIELIFNGVSTDRFNKNINEEEKNNFKERLGLPKDKVIIGFVGSYIYRKGIDILIEALSILELHNYHLVLVGDGDSDWVKSLIDKSNIKDNITLYPFQDPVELYSSFDMFILPSRQEGFPLVPIEAMMMGIPTIRSNVEGSYDQIDHGVNGYIFKNEDYEELSKYIQVLLTNEELRVNMGKRAKEKALASFTEEIMIEKLLNLYNKTNQK